MKKTILLACSVILLGASSFGAAAVEEAEATLKGPASFLKNNNPSYWEKQQKFAQSLGMPGESRTLFLDANPSMQRHPRLNASCVNHFYPRLESDTYDRVPLSFFSKSEDALPFPQGPARIFLYFDCQRKYVDVNLTRNVWGDYTGGHKEEYSLAGPFELQKHLKITLSHTAPGKKQDLSIESLVSGQWSGPLDLSPQSRLSLSLEVSVPGSSSSHVLSSIEALIVPTYTQP